MTQKLVLVVNPGSASRKYGLFDSSSDKQVAQVHFEQTANGVLYTLTAGDKVFSGQNAPVAHIVFAGGALQEILKKHQVLQEDVDLGLSTVVLRVVAPSSYFQQNRKLTKDVLSRLKQLESAAPLHIGGLFQEIALVERYFPEAKLVGVSDSAFHTAMPPEARNYAIPAQDAKMFDVYRFGYHGIALSATTNMLKQERLLPQKTIICHLGSGASVTALLHGASQDTTMGFSPLEGVTMATRSGTLDPVAAITLKNHLGLNEKQIQEYLSFKSGLLGLSGLTGDIRDLLDAERQGNQSAGNALAHYVAHIQKAIGQMAAVLGGIDALVFTGTVGERSAVIRKRIMHKLAFLGFQLETNANAKLDSVEQVAVISNPRQSVPILVVHADESAEMYRQSKELL